MTPNVQNFWITVAERTKKLAGVTQLRRELLAIIMFPSMKAVFLKKAFFQLANVYLYQSKGVIRWHCGEKARFMESYKIYRKIKNEISRH